VTAHLRAPVSGELDEVECVQRLHRAGEIREEDEACLERADKKGLAAFVVAGDLVPELADAGRDLGRREIDLANP